MCCFTKFCMTLEELGRFILRRIYHLRIIPRMIFPKKKLFPSDCVNGKYYLLE